MLVPLLMCNWRLHARSANPSRGDFSPTGGNDSVGASIQPRTALRHDTEQQPRSAKDSAPGPDETHRAP